jgi:hypothetical protein
MRADPASATGHFSRGLLDPDLPIADGVLQGSTRRFGVYRNNVTVGLVRAMEANFPIVRRLLGDSYFEGFAREFVQRHPPRLPLMFLYGDVFCDALAEEKDLRAYPFLPDIARLEQQVRVSYHEADAPTVSANELTKIAEDELMQAIFKPHPAMAVVSSAFAIHSIYKANPAETESVLVTRPLYEVMLNKITPGQLTLVQRLASGHLFGDAADAAFASDDTFDLTSAISLMLTSGAFQSITVGKK